MGAIFPALASAGILNHAKAQNLRNRDNRAEEMAFGRFGGKIRNMIGERSKGMRDYSRQRPPQAPTARLGASGHMRKTQPGPRIDMMETVGRQRVDYGAKPSYLDFKPHPSSISGAVGEHAMLGRRLHSGDLNMINRRRRVQPKWAGGPERLSHRNTQPNRGTYGVGQGFDR